MRLTAAAFVLAFLAGCAAPPPKPVYSERVTLLPNADGSPSVVVITRASGQKELSSAYQSTSVDGGRETAQQLSRDEVQKRYGGVLAAQPARPVTFILFYSLGTTELTGQSRSVLNDITRKVGGFPSAEVTVTGHTDTSGTAELNDALSLSRARSVRDLLVKLGVPSAAIEVVGRGSRELLVNTGPGVREERNRRVEIKLR